MNTIVQNFVKDVLDNAPTGDKEAVIKYLTSHYSFTLDRKVYYTQYFAVRVSYSQSGAFSNTVLSLSAIQRTKLVTLQTDLLLSTLKCFLKTLWSILADLIMQVQYSLVSMLQSRLATTMQALTTFCQQAAQLDSSLLCQ